MAPQVVFGEEQAPQPWTNNEQELANHDVRYLLRYLAQQRNESYDLIEHPDERERQRPAPDYVYREKNSRRLIAIERTLLMDEDLQAAKAKLIKQGAGVIITDPKSIAPVTVARRLAQAIRRKIARGQLQGVAADERILLLRNRIMATCNTFLSYPLRFTNADKRGVDHCYLIANSKLLELW